jgi:hypothetical protein
MYYASSRLADVRMEYAAIGGNEPIASGIR